MVSTVARRHLMETSRTEEPNEHGFVEDSWFRDEKQDGDVHKSSGPSAKGGLSIKERSAKHASLATQKANPVPNPTARQARVSRDIPANRSNIVKRAESKEDNV